MQTSNYKMIQTKGNQYATERYWVGDDAECDR